VRSITLVNKAVVTLKQVARRFRIVAVDSLR